MENNDILDTIQDSFYNLIESAIAFIPELLIAILLLIAGVIVARLSAKIVKAALSFIEDNKWTKKFFSSVDVNMINISDITALFVKWTVLVIFINAAINVLGLALLSDTFDALLAFVPKIFAAVVVAGLTLVAGQVVHDLVLESAKKARINASRFLANTARVIVLIFGFPLAAAQLGLDMTIINNNITVVVAGVMLALGLAFGLGGRDTAGKIVSDAYNNFRK